MAQCRMTQKKIQKILYKTIQTSSLLQDRGRRSAPQSLSLNMHAIDCIHVSMSPAISSGLECFFMNIWLISGPLQSRHVSDGFRTLRIRFVQTSIKDWQIMWQQMQRWMAIKLASELYFHL